MCKNGRFCTSRIPKIDFIEHHPKCPKYQIEKLQREMRHPVLRWDKKKSYFLNTQLLTGY